MPTNAFDVLMESKGKPKPNPNPKPKKHKFSWSKKKPTMDNLFVVQPAYKIKPKEEEG